MYIDRYFDVIYPALNVLFIVGLGAAVIVGVVQSRRATLPAEKVLGRGAALAAVGTAVTLAGGLFADALLKSSYWFQQVRFGVYFVGFALVIIGLNSIIRAAIETREGNVGRLPRFLAAVFVLCCAIAIVFLAVPSTFVLNQYREQIQLPIYWLPLLVGSLAESIALFAVARGAGGLSRRVSYAGVFAALLFFGLLREAGVIPDLGDPVVNLLISFIPFVVAAVFLDIAVWPRRHPTG
jgi:hypothetical protein